MTRLCSCKYTEFHAYSNMVVSGGFKITPHFVRSLVHFQSITILSMTWCTVLHAVLNVGELY